MEVPATGQEESNASAEKASSATSHHAVSAIPAVVTAELRWKDWAQRYRTPFYAYDLEKVQARAGELQSVLPQGAGSQLLYSFKSNPMPAVARQLRECGCRADLTSTGEITASMEAGFDLSEALYGGPGNSEFEIAVALQKGIRQFSIESWHDLDVIAKTARAENVRVRGLLRVNPMEPPRAKLAMSGVPSQFGFDEDELLASGAARLKTVDDVIDIVGIHIYWGTQLGDAEALLACFTNAVETAERISCHLRFPLEVLNLGGGFPWPYAHVGVGPDLSALKEGLAQLHANAQAAKKAQWWFESGRYLSASSGTLVARVMDIKESKGEKTFLILDTGIHHLGGMSGLGRIPRFSIDLEVPAEREGGEEMTVDVVGQLCTPLDCIGRKITLPRLQIGDLVTVPNTGAYGLTGSVTGFLSRPTPVEIAYRGSNVESVYKMRSGHELIS